jgi:hypothetical protein
MILDSGALRTGSGDGDRHRPLVLSYSTKCAKGAVT